MRIAIDAMGGDSAPRVTVEGAKDAAEEAKSGDEILLIGERKSIEIELSRCKNSIPKNLKIHHASEWIDMHEPPAVSVRRKKDSSINVAVQLLKEGAVDAIVAAGNTGAAVCAATLGLGMLEGIERPGIAITLPTLKGISLLIDVGANIDAKPIHLFQYAIMGAAFMRDVRMIENPTVGLLNIGEEESKGTELIKEAYRILEQRCSNFVGNIEGYDLFAGTSNVIVCDGFVGNVALKVSESLAHSIELYLKKALNRNPMTRFGALLSRSAFSFLRKETDYAEYGGAPLLGIHGTCIICHGKSSAKAIKNAVLVAREFITQGVNRHIVEAIKGL